MPSASHYEALHSIRQLPMISDLKSIKSIKDIPFGGILWDADPHPVLFDDLVPGMDLVIWKMRPCVHEAVTMELRQAALRTLDRAVENKDGTPGTAIYEFDGYSFFAFQTAYRHQVLAEMGIKDLAPW